MIYLDYNATTPVDPAVLEAMRPFLSERFGNPSSGHALGAAAREALDAARSSVANLIGASAGEIVFTGGGTEGINTAVKGVAFAGGRKGGHIVTTVVDHPATFGPITFLKRFGYSHTAVRVDRTGWVDPDDVRRAIRADTVLVSVIHAQNEVGTIEPVAEIGRAAREAGVLFHVDAAQSTGKIPLNVDEIGADLLSIAGHKMYAPKGSGALYVRRGTAFEPLIHGAGQEGGRRAGTENVAYAVGLGRAAELAAEHTRDDSVRRLRDLFWELLADAFGGRVVLNGHPSRRLPNTLNVNFSGRVGGDILSRAADICASTGAACHAGDAKPSGVLTAMGIGRERAIGAIRFSLGRRTCEADVHAAVESLKDAMA